MQRERCTWQCWHRDVPRKAGVTGQHLPATHQRSRGTRSSQCNLTYAPNMFLISYTTAFKDYLKRNIEITSTGKVLADSCWEHGVQGCTAWESQSSPTPLFAVGADGLNSLCFKVPVWKVREKSFCKVLLWRLRECPHVKLVVRYQVHSTEEVVAVTVFISFPFFFC